MFNLDRIDIPQYIYFYSKYLLLCHKLLKYEPRYDLQSKMAWHSDFKSFTDSCSRYNSEEKSLKLPIPITKLNRINASFPVQVL